jgi:hypothetical protein
VRRARLATGAAIGLSGALAVCAWLLLSEDGDELRAARRVGAGGGSGDGAVSGAAGAAPRAAEAVGLPDPAFEGAARLDPSALTLPEGLAGRGVLLIRALWATDSLPAPGVELEVTAWDEPDRDARTRSVRTDAEGQVGFREVAAGFITVDAPRGGQASVELLADDAAELEIVVSDDLLVRGRVLDAAGRPAEGAPVWVSVHPGTEVRVTWGPDAERERMPSRRPPVEGPVDIEHGRIAAFTDTAGRFELKGLSPGQAVAAFDEVASPSPLLVLEDDETRTLDIALQLGPPGAALEGRVVDSIGAPVVHAVVKILPEPERLLPASRVVTAADGRFEASGLPPGTLTVRSSASSGAQREVAVTLESGETGYVTLDLQSPAVLVCKAVDAHGRPVEDVRMRLRAAGHTSTSVHRDGAHVFENLLPGEVQLTAWHPDLGSARATLTVEESGSHRWDAALVEGPALGGRLVYADGQPAAFLSVEIEPDGYGWPEEAVRVSDADGRFRFRNCPEDRYLLSVGDARPVLENALVREIGVSPGSDELLVTVPRPENGEARAHGRLLMEEPALFADAGLLLLQSPTREHVARLDAESGEFQAGPVRTGEHWLVLRCESGRVWPLTRVAMQAGLDLDLGVLRVPRAGELELHVEWDPETPRARVMGMLLLEPESGGALLAEYRAAYLYDLEGSPMRASSVRPGRYTLRIEGKTIAPVCRPVTIEPGAMRVETVRVAAGLRTEIWVTVPEERWTGVEAHVRVDLLDALGLTVASWTSIERKPDGMRQLARQQLRVLRGAYRALVRLDEVLVLDQPITISAAGAAAGIGASASDGATAAPVALAVR